ncbi:uncharacterized protein LOC134464580 [Engraulis encrasicolus]|uniref:uncharacterized protein LOC134464580 n=1 Tax=Engraulis encrasicolus TaxID=184585 RepID=UPI002FD538F5
MMRETLDLEAKKRNNEETVATMMARTFAHRRQEIIRDAPLIAVVKMRWPALFDVRELSAEFKRITTVALLPRFFSELDALSAKLLQVFSRKGGSQARTIQRVLVPMTQTDNIDVKRECILKALTVYLNEEPDKVVKEQLDTDVDVDGQAETGMVFGVRVIRKEGAEVHERPEEVLIVLEGVEVLTQLGNVPVAYAMLFALMYALNLRYPPEWKYTFEALQKLIMGLDGQRLSKKLQVLKTLLAR